MDVSISQKTTVTRTILLFVFFTMALCCLVTFMYMGVIFVLHVLSNPPELENTAVQFQFWRPGVFAMVASLSVLAVSIGCVFKFRQLLQGLAPLVDELDGRRASAEVPEEAVFIDVVQEVALTAGVNTPVPIIIERERAINAIALGDVDNQAVIAVTEGALITFTRDELQAVVAHELAHLVHGDSVLGLRMVSLLHGMVGITSFGLFLCEVGSRERTWFSKEKPAGRPRAIFPLLILGLGIAAAGFAGLVAGGVVKRLITRGREYGADKEAVGLLGESQPLIAALLKISEENNTSVLRNREAKICGHMFFADVAKPSIFNKLSTHPSLHKRIRKIDPEFSLEQIPELLQSTRESTALLQSDRLSADKAVVVEPKAIEVANVIQHLRSPVVGTVQAVRTYLNQVPREVRRALHQGETAVPVLYCIFLSVDEDLQVKQVEFLQETVSSKVKEDMEKAYASLHNASFSLRYLLLLSGIESLKQLDSKNYLAFRGVVEKLVNIVENSHFRGHILLKVMSGELDKYFGLEQEKQEVSEQSIDDAVLNAMTVVSMLSNSQRKVDEARQALGKALAHLSFEDALSKANFENCTNSTFDEALEVLLSAPVPVRISVLEGVGECVAFDGVVDSEEVALVHALARYFSIGVPALVQIPENG